MQLQKRYVSASVFHLHHGTTLPPEVKIWIIFGSEIICWKGKLSSVFTKGKLSPLKTIFQKKYSYINLLERKFFLRWNTSDERNYLLKRKILFSTRNYLLKSKIFISERKIFSKKIFPEEKYHDISEGNKLEITWYENTWTF